MSVFDYDFAALKPILTSMINDAERGEFRDFSAAEQGAMAVQSVVVAFQNAKQLDEQRSKTLQARVDALYNTVENEDSYASSRFVAALKDVRAAAP